MQISLARKISLTILLTFILISTVQISSQATDTGLFEPLTMIKSQNALQPLKQGEKVNITLEIKNDSEFDIYNVSFSDVYSNDTFRVIRSTASIENTSIEYDFTENTTVDYTWDTLTPGETVRFWTELQITTNQTIQYTIEETTVTFQDEYGLSSSQNSNTVIIPISGEKTKSYEIPEGTIEADLPIIAIIYLVPILFLLLFGFLLRNR